MGKADMDKMVAGAENEAEGGNLEGSKFKLMLANELKEKIKDMEDQYIKTHTVAYKGEDICDICGARFDSLTSKNVARHQAHFKGALHLFHVKVRQWIKDLKENHKLAGTDQQEGRRRSKSPRKGRSPRKDRSRSARKGRSRSRRDRRD